MYLGCYIDTNNRAVPDNVYFDSSTNTHDKCFQHCRSHNQRYVAMQNGQDCWCGSNGVAYGKYGQVPEAECDVPCPGEASKTCGGENRNSVFDLLGKYLYEL